MKRLNNIATPGVAEQMLIDGGFEIVEIVERGERVSMIEWPDAELAWRALSSAGPAVPALNHTDPEIVEDDVLAAIEHCRDSRGTYRFQNDHHFVIGRRRSPSTGWQTS